MHEGLITRWMASHIACSDVGSDFVAQNKIAAWNLPLGTIIQIYNAQARGEEGCLSDVGLNTFVDPRVDGAALNPKAKEIDEQLKKEGKLCLVNYIEDFYGKEKLYYTGWNLNIGWMRGTYADKHGNISCDHESVNIEMLTIAQAVKACGGKVFVEVEKIVEVGEINPHMVKVPGMYIDYIVVSEHPENRMITVGGYHRPDVTGEVRVDLSADEGSADVIPFDYKKIFLRRAAMEIEPGMYANFGLGMPQSVGGVIAEEGCGDYLTMISESGNIGGVPLAGVNFGAHVNVESMTDQGDHFRFFDGQGLDLAMFGLAEADANGDMNTNIVNGAVKGVGGFMNIACGAQNIVILGTFTAAGFKERVEDGKLIIDQNGKFRKFIEKLDQNSFDCIGTVKRGIPVTIVTERAVFKGTENGIMLTEIAPGLDLQKDILDHMGFKPLIKEGGPDLMNPDIFQEKWGKLKDIVDAKGALR
jgi:propionate CoA-transferase